MEPANPPPDRFVERRLLWLNALSLLAIGVWAGCAGSGSSSTQISTVAPHVNPKAHHRVLAAIAEHRARVAKANAGNPRVIAFWDGEHGLLGTGSDQYPPDQRYCDGTIALTADGGHTFRTVLRTHGIVSWVDTADTQDAWAVVDKCGRPRHGAARQLLHTDDGGASWDRRAVVQEGSGRTRPAIWQPSFATPTQGVSSVASVGQDARLMSGTGRALATSDGGRSWQATASPCRHADGMAVSFPRPSAAWAVCTQTPGAGAQDKIIARSTDGGSQWQQVAHVSLEHPNRAGLSEGGYVQGVSFDETGLGFLLYEEGGGLYRTQDGGYQWKPISADVFPTSPGAHQRKGGSPISLATPSAATGFGLFYEKGWQLASSSDGGQSWAVVHRWPLIRLHK